MSHITPDPIMQLLSSHMTAKYLFAATQLELFEKLLDTPRTLAALADQIGIPPQRLRILADALVATGFLERHDDLYANSPVTATFLSGGPGPDLRPIVRLWDQLVYRQWITLEEALRSGRATFGFAAFTPEEQHIFSVGVEALTARSAQALASSYNFERHQRMLDLGGGTGSFLFAVLQHTPTLHVTLFERPATIAVVRERLMQMPAMLNFEIIEGNFLEDPIPTGYDVVLLANVIHLFSPHVNQQLLQRARAAMELGTRLLLVDFWTDPTHTRPPFAALMAGEFLIVTGEGDVYSTDEVSAWLDQTGWRFVEHTPLAGAASLIVAEAIG